MLGKFAVLLLLVFFNVATGNNTLSSGYSVLLEEKIPRLLVLLMSGASLASAGALMQGVFQNPLASPGTLGVSAISSFFVLLAFASGLHLLHILTLPLFAFGGSLLSLLFLHRLSGGHDRQWAHGRDSLLLSGIALSTFFFSLQHGLLYALRDDWELMHQLREWEAGSAWNLGWEDVWIQAPLFLMGTLLSFPRRQELTIFSLGSKQAHSLGVDTENLRWDLFFAVAFFVSGCQSTLGNIPFYAFVLPQILRLIYGPSYKVLLPQCIFWGATVLAAMDFCLQDTRLHFLSLGSVSSFIGGSYFLFLLFFSRHSQRKSYA